MKILCVCNQGNNRSVQFAHILKYWKHDTIPIGIDTTTKETLKILYKWADVIICTDETQVIPAEYQKKYRLWNVGPDIYPRPFNKELRAKATTFLEENKDWLKN